MVLLQLIEINNFNAKKKRFEKENHTNDSIDLQAAAFQKIPSYLLDHPSFIIQWLTFFKE